MSNDVAESAEANDVAGQLSAAVQATVETALKAEERLAELQVEVGKQRAIRREAIQALKDEAGMDFKRIGEHLGKSRQSVMNTYNGLGGGRQRDEAYRRAREEAAEAAAEARRQSRSKSDKARRSAHEEAPQGDPDGAAPGGDDQQGEPFTQTDQTPQVLWREPEPQQS